MADRSGDPLARQLYLAAAKAYAEWAVEMEQIARTTQSIERSARAAEDRIFPKFGNPRASEMISDEAAE